MNGGVDRDCIIQLGRLAAVHAYATVRDRLADGPGFICTVDAIDAPGHAKPHEMASELRSPESFFSDGPIARGRRS